MRKLFKNALKAFLQAKVAMLLLAILVFVSSTAFTMLNASSISFQTSYETVMHEGNVHDFTIKPKWDIKGTSELKLKKMSETINIPSLKKQTTDKLINSNGIKEIYMGNVDDSKIIFPKEQKNKTPTYKLDLSHAFLSYDKNDEVQISGGAVYLYFYTGGKNQLSNTDKLNEEDRTVWTKNPIKISPTTKSGISTRIDWDGYNKEKGWLSDSWVLNNKHFSTNVTINQNGQEFLSNLIKKIQPHLDKKTYEQYEIDESILSGAFQLPSYDWSKLANTRYPFLVAQGSTAETVLKDVIKTASKNLERAIYSERTSFYINNIKNLSLKSGEKLTNYLYSPANVKSIMVTSKTNQFKVVSSRFKNVDVNKTVIFKGDKPGMPYTDDEMTQGLNNAWDSSNIGTTSIKKNKSFRWTKESKIPFIGAITGSVGFDNFEALQAVISSSYVNEHNLQIMTKKDLANFRSRYLSGEKEEKLFKEYKAMKKVATVDNTNYLITGIGSSPDFAFPIINQQNPLPNSKTQAILFTTKLGYDRIEDAFRANETENYISFKFKNNISENIRQEILSIIADDASSKMSWPKNISPLTMKDDINEKVILAPQRISFLGKIQRSISSISYLTTSLLSTLTLFIIIMVVKKQINSKRKIMGTLLANGYSKNQIALSMMSIALIIVTIPAALGYIAGYFSQALFISIFNNYWTLPIVFSPFSMITLGLVILFPMAITMFIAYIFTRIELKGELLAIIKESNSKTGGWITSKVLGALTFVGTKTKVTISLFTSNISKMLMVAVTSIAAILTGSIAFSIIGKFAYAQKMSSAPINYSFKIDLATPTSEENTYKLSNLENYGLPKDVSWLNTIDPNDMYGPKAKNDGLPYFHTPDMSDSGSSGELNYLKNKIQTQFLLDQTIAGVANPWSIAKGTMPENQLNQAHKQDEKFREATEEALKNYKNLKWYTALDASQTKKVSDMLDKIIHFNIHKLITETKWKSPELFKNAIFFGLKNQIYNKQHGLPSYLPFMISYGNIVKEKQDEVYSQLSFNYSAKTRKGQTLVSSRIVGLKENDNHMVNLSEKSMKALKENSLNDIDTVDDETDAIPVVINKYFEEAYGVNKGDIFLVDITNHKDKNNASKKHKTKVKVVGVEETYNGIKIYSLQKYVNNKIGFAPSKTGQDVFNGIFTKEQQNPLIFQGVNLYSDSGYYLGVSTLTSSDPLWKKIAEKIKTNKGKMPGNDSVTDFSSFIAAYSATPYVLSMANASWVAMSEYAFQSTLDLTNKMIWMIESIAILISILFIAIIASMVVNDNKRFIATSKTLGYTNKEIKQMFFRSLVPSLLLALGISVPMSIGALVAIKYIVMSFGAILVPLHIIWWAIPLAFVLLVTMFSIIYKITMLKFGNEEMLEAFKV